jgi:hypothetical protein
MTMQSHLIKGFILKKYVQSLLLIRLPKLNWKVCNGTATHKKKAIDSALNNSRDEKSLS